MERSNEADQENTMGQAYDKSPRDFLLDLITSDMNLARAFTAVSKSAYQLGKVGEGDFARLKAIQLYSEAARLVTQLNESLQETLGHELQVLSTAINWLFMPPTEPGERVAVEKPLMARPSTEDFARGE